MTGSSEQNRRDVRIAMSQERIGDVEAVCKRVFGTVPDRVAFPGGESRSAFVADVAGQICVIAERKDEAAAMLEAQALKAFAGTRHAPEFVARHKNWLIQECLPGERLPIAIDRCDDMDQREELVGDALDALLVLHRAAHSAGLQHRIQKVGATNTWYRERLSQGDLISKKTGIDAPDFDRKATRQVLTVRHNEFVKRDARPGNAMIFQGRHVWFDFEDCGRRRALDDLAWVICDEWTAIDEAAEDRLVGKYLPLFAGKADREEATRYLNFYGAMHMMWRLRLIIKYRVRQKEWWDREKCLMQDKVGITEQEARRICLRLKRWAEREPELLGIVSWTDRLMNKMSLKQPGGPVDQAA